MYDTYVMYQSGEKNQDVAPLYAMFDSKKNEPSEQNIKKL